MNGNAADSVGSIGGWLAPAGGTLGAVAFSAQNTLTEELLFGLHCATGALIGLLIRHLTGWAEARLRRKPHPPVPPATPAPAPCPKCSGCSAESPPPHTPTGSENAPPPPRPYYDD